MSIEAWVAVLHAEIADSPKKAVLAGLANHAGPDGRHAYPSVVRLSVYSGLAERTVTRVLGELVTDGLVSIVRQGGGRGHPTEYALDMERLAGMRDPRLKALDMAVAAYRERVSGSQGSDAQGQPLGRERVTLTPQRVTLATGKGDSLSPEPLITSHNPQEEQEETAAPPPPRTSRDQTPWNHALLALKKTLNKADYDTWVRDTEILSISNGSVIIGARNSYGAEWLREHVALNVAAALAHALGRPVKVAFEVAPPSSLPSSLGE